MTSADMDDVVTPLPGTKPSGIIYSTTEQKIGKWIDGSDLFEKTVLVNQTMENAGSFYVDAGIPTNTIDIVVDIEAMGYASSGTTVYWRNIPKIQDSNSTENATIQVNTDTSRIYIYSRGGNSSNWTVSHVTIRYTKVTT